MNREIAIEILGLVGSSNNKIEEKIDIDQIKRQYRIMALKYHPDKNKSATAVEQFQNIHSAYEFLLRDTDNNNGNNNNNNGTNESLDFDTLLNMFLDTVLDDESVIFKKILGILIPKVINAIKGIDISKIQSILQPIDSTILDKIRGFFAKYAHIFEGFADFGNLSNTLNEIDNNIKIWKRDQPTDPYNHILLHPLLEDLFQNNLYKCMENGHLLVIPLWHQELLYVLSGYEILVECYPILPDNISIDENNDMFILLEYGLMELWFMENIDIEIGGKRILIEKESLKMVQDQQIILKGEGISKINEEDIYCILEKSDIYVNIRILVG
jgi:hypothetical protein